MSKEKYFYVADFETIVPISKQKFFTEHCNNDEAYTEYLKSFETSVWLACYADVSKINDKNTYIVTDNIRDFLKKLLYDISLLPDNIEPVVFFHNLKFDGSFLLNFLNSLNLPYETFISDMGAWYSVEIETDKHKITFRDSLKVMNFKLSVIAEQVLSNDNEEILKGETPLLTEKPSLIKEEWKEYVKRDVEILGKAIDGFYNNENYKKFTSASEALYEFKKTVGGSRKFRQIFPILDEKTDTILRFGYRGGFTFVNPKFQNKIINKKIDVYDVNSMYPSTMLNFALPYGKPEIKNEYIEPKKDKLCVYQGKFCFDLKKDKIPSIQIRDTSILSVIKKTKRDYLTTSNDLFVNMVVTQYDLELMKSHYNLDYEIEKTFIFNAKKGMFDNYIKKYQHRKENAENAFQKLDAKIKLNSLYGKFGAKIKQQQKIPVFKDNILSFKNSDVEIVDPVYLPVAMFITSICRYNIITDAQNNYENFIYSDTDSLHLIHSNNIDLPIHPKKFGYWKLEEQCTRGKYLRPKLYIEETLKGELIVTGAGMTDEVKKQVTFENFNFGEKFEGKRAQTQVKGGIIIYDTEFTIRENFYL